MSGKNFEMQFEYHKIPEYYDQYLKYGRMKQILKQYKKRMISIFLLLNPFRRVLSPKVPPSPLPRG